MRLNYEKVAMAIRTELLVDLAARYVGNTASIVYKGLLQVLEEKQSHCFDEFDANVYQDEDLLPEANVYVTSSEILSKLDVNLDLSKELPPDDCDVTNGVADGESDSEDEDDSSANHNGATATTLRREWQVEQHIGMLCDDPRQFATAADSTRGGPWRVRFRQLCRHLLQQEIEDAVVSRWGTQALRIVRLLHARGRLEEKDICEWAMLKVKDVRLITRAMQEAGYLDAQEVPRDNTRQASRSIFLWFFDQEDVQRMLLHDTYKCMARLLQRRDVERASIKTLLDKAERIGSAEKKAKLLSKDEKLALKMWERKETKLLVQVARHDNVVALLRDFLPDHK